MGSFSQLRSDGGLERCMHCWGSGEEPFSDGEQCGICVGECYVPRGVNEKYYEVIKEAIDDAG